MKLEEKMYFDCTLNTEEQVKKNVEVAKKFAIKFAEWIRENYYDVGNSWCEWNSDKNTYSSEELLERFIVSTENE